jgi:TonB family protein
LLLFAASIGLTQTIRTATTSEQVLRAHATKVVRPAFPADASRHQQTGVAVAEVHLNPAGLVSQVEILEAPTPSIAQSVSEAVAQWQFTPFTMSSGEPMLLSAKLTFYFEMKGGKGVVLNPADTGYVGKWPETSRKRISKKG